MKDKTRCGQCQHYAELKEPFHYEAEGYPVGITVYGFCGKSAEPAINHFFPVYLPDGGVCNDYMKKRSNKP